MLRGKTSLAAVGLGLVFLLAIPGHGRAEVKESVRRQLIDARRRALTARESPAPAIEPKFGVFWPDSINVHAYAFQANTSSDLILDDGNGYRYFGAPAVPYMAAAVQLPAGADLFDDGVGGSGSGGGTLIASSTSLEGCRLSGDLDVPGGFYDAIADHPLYLVVFFAGNHFDGSSKFNDVTVGFRRRVSPAPAAATFGDVPTGDPAFLYIEALVASGVTGGCGGGNYCPDNFVTRRQMAVFLAKSLGLHWPF